VVTAKSQYNLHGNTRRAAEQAMTACGRLDAARTMAVLLMHYFQP